MTQLQTYQDEQLMQLISQEDSRPAFAELYNRYWKKLLLHARCQIGSELEAEEIVQNVFLYIWRIRKNLTIRTTFNTYIFSCAKYEILTVLAWQKKQHAHKGALLNIVTSIDCSTSEWLDYESTRKQLETTIQSLPEKCQLIFRLSRENGMSEKQIAEHLNISEKTVQAHKTKAIKILRANLQQFIILFT